LLAVRAGWFVSGAVNLRFERHHRNENPFLDFREFEADRLLSFVEQGNAFALGIACASGLLAVMVMLTVLAALSALSMAVAIVRGVLRLLLTAGGKAKADSESQH
jgi:hypothetical protein